MPNPRRQRSFWARIKPFNSFYSLEPSKEVSFDLGSRAGQSAEHFFESFLLAYSKGRRISPTTVGVTLYDLYFTWLLNSLLWIERILGSSAKDQWILSAADKPSIAFLKIFWKFFTVPSETQSDTPHASCFSIPTSKRNDSFHDCSCNRISIFVLSK